VGAWLDLFDRVQAVVEYDAFALLEASTEHVLDHVAVRAGDRIVETAKELERLLERRSFCEALIGNDLEPERRDGLRAANVGARENVPHATRLQDVA
jgi:hypothetical protein